MSEADTDLQLETPVETPAVEPVKTPAVESNIKDPTGLRDTITKAVRDSAEKEAAKVKPTAAPVKPAETVEGERPRGADGKFLPKDAAPQPAPKVEPKPSEGAQPGAVQPKADAAPGTWRTEAKAEWDKLPANAKSEILRRESESSREIGKYQQQIQQINQAYTPIEQVIGPKRAAWRAQFGSEGEALKRLVNLSDFAGSDPTGFLSYFLSQPDIAGRVDLQKIFGPQAEGQSLNDRASQAMRQEIDGLKQQLQGFLGQQQTQQVQTVEQQITEFASAKDQTGNPLHPHFESVREDVFNLIPALKAQFPQFTVSQILDKAYNVAIRTNDSVSGEIARADQERMRSDIERQERAKKAQLANKSIPPGAPAAPAPLPASQSDLRAELVRNMRSWQQGNEPRV